MNTSYTSTTDLNSEIKEMWASGIRKGLLKEGKSFLFTADGEFDPLGILFDNCIKNYMNLSKTQWNNVETAAQGVIIAWVDSQGPEVSLPITTTNNEGFSFSALADFIEKNL